jgi:DNA-binding transcriptional regulator LsrR (DeoR family)
MENLENQKFLLKIAWLYHIQGLTQDQIAKRVSLSRPTIIRALQQAQEKGLVEIRLTMPLPHTTFLENNLEEAFSQCGLREVIVVDEINNTPPKAVAQAASKYLQRILRPKHILGVGWSSTLGSIPEFFTPGQYVPNRIVQLVGSVGNVPGVNSYEIAFQLGNQLNVPVEYIPTPMIVETTAIRDALVRDHTISNTLMWANRCNIALVGVGAINPDSTLIQTGYLTHQDFQLLADQGCVGDILTRYYDIQGQEFIAPWNERMIGLNLEQIRKIDNLIAVASGKEKALAVLGALRGGYINTLIVDVELAKQILSHVTPTKECANI